MSSLFTQPLTAGSQRPQAYADTTATSTSGSTAASGTTSGQTSLSSLGTTFMSLLVQELQNQDPTAPMDTTQMVGQMISLNELDQTASINQLLTNTLGSSSSSGSTSSSTGSASSGTTAYARAASHAAPSASATPSLPAALNNGPAARLPGF